MPRPVRTAPVCAGAGDGRACQPAADATRLITAASRASFVWASRKAIGSAPAAAASSSMNDSVANVFWSRLGERSGPVNSHGEYTPYEITRSLANEYQGVELRPSSPSGGDGGGEGGGGDSGNPASMPAGTLPGGPGRPPRLAVQPW